MKYDLMVSWTMIGKLTIEADSMDAAKAKAFDPEVGLPDGEYLEDSFVVDDIELSAESDAKKKD